MGVNGGQLWGSKYYRDEIRSKVVLKGYARVC